jgi:hypothetical protein
MNAIAEEKSLIGLAGDDARFIARSRILSKELHREVYKNIFIIVELDKALEFLDEDNKKNLAEFLHNWGRWYEQDLTPEDPKTLNEYQAGVVDEIVEKTEGLLCQFLPNCQSGVIEKLAANLPKRLAEDELEELRDNAGGEVTDAVMASGLDVKGQIVVLKKMREIILKARRENAGKKQINR